MRILIVDDNSATRKALKTFINEQNQPEFVTEASSGEQAVRMIENRVPDIIILNMKMTHSDALHTSRKITDALPDAHIIAINLTDEDVYFEDMLSAGIKAYLDCTTLVTEFNRALNLVSAGGYFYPVALHTYSN
jgi:DNA-binding NarL/FixJ family response regulator